MPIIKCKMCGGDLNIVEDSTVCECEYCGTKQTVPKVDDEKKLKLFERANRLRAACEFDKAAGVYESIVADFDEEAEAYWGLILCKFGIEYVDDPATGNKIPTCHRSSFDSLMDDPNFDMVMECADPIARRLYREEAKQIEELRKRIIEVSSQEDPYDVFISYKELDEDGQRTLDSVIAQDIYTELTDKGYRVFFSRISLEDKLGVEYEPYIFAALNSAKVMLVVGTDYDYFNAVWVKNEWSRFLALISSGQKKTLIPVFKGIDAYDMPKEFRKLAAQDMGKVGAMQDLVRGVEKLLGKKSMEETPKEQQVIVQSGGPNVAALLDRGMMALEDSEWEKARDFFDQVLNMDSRNATAYLGLAMGELNCSNKNALRDAYTVFGSACRNNKYPARAQQFGDNQLSIWFSMMESDARKNDSEAEEKERIKKELAIAERKAKEKRRAICQHMIAAGESHTVGVNIDGTLIATKYTGSTQLYKIQCDIAIWKDINAVAVGENHTLGLKVNGTVVSTRQAGRSEVYSDQCEVSDWVNIKAISVGTFHSVGLRSDGTVITVGENRYGQCKVSSWYDIIAISAGLYNTVGLKNDGTVIATKSKNQFFYHGQCEVSEWESIIAIAAGNDHTVGLKKDGTVVATKYIGDHSSYHGQCEVSEWTNIVAIAAGAFHTVGLKADGTVVATNYLGNPNNNYGQCEVSGWTDIIAIAAGSFHTVGLKEDGTLIAVGLNDCGQCNVEDWKLFESNIDLEAEQKKARIIQLTKTKKQLEDKREKISGLFAAKRRKEIDTELAWIDAQLQEL